MTNANRIDWKIPLVLLCISAIPLAEGIARLMGISGNPAISIENARFVAAPLPVIVHILSVILYSIFGALQFSSGIRQLSCQWHKASGRVVVASGILTALSGLWMTVKYPIPSELQGSLLYGVRVFVSVALLFSIFIAVAAVAGGAVTTHRAWMIRAFALSQGAGMQVVVLLPWMLLIGKPSMLHRDVLMSLAWLINLLFAEMAIQKWSPRNLNSHRGTV